MGKVDPATQGDTRRHRGSEIAVQTPTSLPAAPVCPISTMFSPHTQECLLGQPTTSKTTDKASLLPRDKRKRGERYNYLPDQDKRNEMRHRGQVPHEHFTIGQHDGRSGHEVSGQSRVEGSLLRAQLLSQEMEKAEISPEGYKSSNFSKLLKVWSEG